MKSEYLLGVLNRRVNETFNRCIGRATLFPEQRIKLNSIATKTTELQELIFNEINNFFGHDERVMGKYIDMLNVWVEQKI